MSCNRCSNSGAGSCVHKLHFKLDESYLVPYVGGEPLEPINLAPVLTLDETDTRLQLDQIEQALVYTGERAAKGEANPDVITIAALAELINTHDLRNFAPNVPVDGDLLIYDETLGYWKPFAITAGTLVTAIGYDADGVLRYQDVTALTQTPPDLTPRKTDEVSVATLTFDLANFDQFNITAQTDPLTIASPGVSDDHRLIVVRVKDDGTPQSVTFNAIFRFIGVTPPASTVANKVLYIGARYNAQDNKWDVLSVGRE